MREEFLELLRTDRAFREDVRRQILTEDLLALPGRLDHLTELVGQSVSLLQETVGLVRRLAEVQLRTEERVGRLEGRMEGVESALQRLTEAQLRTEERVGRLEGRMEGVESALQRLTEAQLRTEERVGQLEGRMEGVESALQRLTEAQLRTEERIGQLEGRMEGVESALQRLTEAQLRTEERIGQLEGRMEGVESALQRLTEAQLRTEEELRSFASWQRGESGRRDGERYERDTIRRALALFNGGQGGGPEQPWVQQRLMEQLGPHIAWGLLEPEEDPLLADVLWWKGEQLAVVEISLQVNGQDVARAARRATTLRQAGPQTLAVVVGEDWATPDSRDRALAQQVEWKVGSDLSEGLLAFRRAPSR